MTAPMRELAIVTGASSGIGFELARLAAEHGYDLVIAADEPDIHSAAEKLKGAGRNIEAVEADLSTLEGVDKLYAAVQSNGGRIGALLANAGRGLGEGFLDQRVEEWRKVVDTNITGTLYLVHKVGNDLRAQNSGCILITGSIAGFMPGSFQAVYNGTKAFIDSFSLALRNELKDTAVTVTCLMPGATETEFFERAGISTPRLEATKRTAPQPSPRSGSTRCSRARRTSSAGGKTSCKRPPRKSFPPPSLPNNTARWRTRAPERRQGKDGA